MCDYSMHALKNRKAVVGDTIKTSNFGGHSSPGIESSKPGEAMTAICLLPGTGIEFDQPIQYRNGGYSPTITNCKIGRYVRRPSNSYSDYLQLTDGTMVLIAYLVSGQYGKVTYVPEEVIKQVDEPATKTKSRMERLTDLLTIG